jgi:hypothetical protein
MKYKSNFHAEARIVFLQETLKELGFTFNCEKCGTQTNAQSREIHHKDGNYQNNHKKNLVLLCLNCHKLEHGKIKFGLPLTDLARKYRVSRNSIKVWDSIKNDPRSIKLGEGVGYLKWGEGRPKYNFPNQADIARFLGISRQRVSHLIHSTSGKNRERIEEAKKELRKQRRAHLKE